MKINSQIKIENGVDLSALDFKTLSLLYMPIIGIEAYSLYNLFLQIIYKSEKLNITTRFLLDMLNIKITKFNEARSKLEAIGLVETYLEDDIYYVYLKSPFTTKQFLSDTIMGSYLQSEIGENNLSLILNLLKDNTKPKTGKNITKEFDELFTFDSCERLNINMRLQGRSELNNIQVKYNFDYSKFVDNIPNRLKGEQLLSTKFREQLIKLAYVYQLNELELVEVYSSSPRKTINHLNLTAQNFFVKNNKQVVVKEIEDDAYQALENATPDEILTSANVDSNYHGMARSTYFEIINKYSNINIGVINTLVINLLKIKDGILPNTRYLEVVLNDWLSKGITTTKDAVDHVNGIKTEYESRNKSYKAKSKKVANVPDWMDEYLSEIKGMDDK